MKQLLPVIAAALLAGCASGEATIQQGPDAERTFDGLVGINNSVFRRAWIDPDVDLTQYDKIILGPTEFEFRAVKKTPGISSIRSNRANEYWIAEKDRAKLVETVTDVFGEELARSKHFTVTTEPGPNTLLIVATMHDIVSRVPPRLAGAGEIYLSSVGEATLIVELRDSLSNETIYRGADRRKIERPGGGAIEANAVTTWAEVRRWARRWATRMRDGLDAIHG